METNRCKLVELQETDYVDVKRLYSDVKVREFLGGPVSEEEFNAKFERMIKSKNDAIYWVIRQRESSLFIGLISLALHHDGVHVGKHINYEKFILLFIILIYFSQYGCSKRMTYEYSNLLDDESKNQLVDVLMFGYKINNGKFNKKWTLNFISEFREFVMFKGK